jgi:hypothetical protein
VDLVGVSVRWKRVRDRCSKRHERKDGDLIFVRKASLQGCTVAHSPEENAWCEAFSVYAVRRDRYVFEGVIAWEGSEVL